MTEFFNFYPKKKLPKGRLIFFYTKKKKKQNKNNLINPTGLNANDDPTNTGKSQISQILNFK